MIEYRAVGYTSGGWSVMRFKSGACNCHIRSVEPQPFIKTFGDYQAEEPAKLHAKLKNDSHKSGGLAGSIRNGSWERLVIWEMVVQIYYERGIEM